MGISAARENTSLETGRQVSDFNTLIRFLSRRDIPELSPAALRAWRGLRQVDLLILVGGITTPDIIEWVVEAYRNGVAKRLMAVGGIGHSTDNLRQAIRTHPRYGAVPTCGRAEADMIAEVMVAHLGVPPGAVVVENQSTNCGNNTTFALEAVRQAGAVPRSAIIVQDSAMQYRMHECFLHEWKSEQTVFASHAPYVPILGMVGGEPCVLDPKHRGFHPVDNLLQLVMGEIPRLRDDENGYGPNGHGFFGHVDLPEEVEAAFGRLLETHAAKVRKRYTGDMDKRG